MRGLVVGLLAASSEAYTLLAAPRADARVMAPQMLSVTGVSPDFGDNTYERRRKLSTYGGGASGGSARQGTKTFSPVFGDEDLPMLKRAHRAWVHIQVWIELQDRNAVATRFEQATKAGGHDSFADAGDDTTGDEDELGHEPLVDSSMYPSHQGVQVL